MFDVDGTLIPAKEDGTPSKKVITAINQASKIIHVGIATSRPYSILPDIIDKLSLSGPSVINGGAQVMDMNSRKVVWEQIINHGDLEKIYQILEPYKLPLIILDDGVDIPYSKGYIPKKPLQVWLHALELKLGSELRKKLSSISTIAVQKVPSWQVGKVDVLISHALATKQHGIFEVAKLLNIETEDIIGVGDGYNDFPLLMACGLKVAMGNAVEELKEIADVIAPTVDDDGAAWVIENYALNK